MQVTYSIGDNGALVSGASFGEDKASVITFCKEFYVGVTVELNSERTLYLIK